MKHCSVGTGSVDWAAGPVRGQGEHSVVNNLPQASFPDRHFDKTIGQPWYTHAHVSDIAIVFKT